MYHVQEERYAEAVDASSGAWERQIALEANFADPAKPLVPELGRMDEAELREYARLVAATFESVRLAKSRLKNYYGANNGALQGVYEIRHLMVFMAESAAAHPDPFEQVAK